MLSDKSNNYSSAQSLGMLLHKSTNTNEPILLFQAGNHAIYWLGIAEDTAFRCNIFLIKNGEEGLLIDPGGKNAFDTIKERVMQVMPLQQIKGLILSHQDPDVSASMPDWLKVNPEMHIFSSPRTHVLLRYYQLDNYTGYDVEQEPCFRFANGNELRFIPSPFLHAPGSFATFDISAGYLLSGDIWSSLDTQWQLIVNNFSAHTAKMDLFNKDYMASQLATRGFLHSLATFDIQAILPQHGALIPQDMVAPALDYLWNLECGLDLIYQESTLQGQRPVDSQSLNAALSTLSPSAGYIIPQADKTHCDEADKNEPKFEAQNIRLKQALDQATRLAKLRDQALLDLRTAEHRLRENETRLSEAQAIAKLGHWEWNVLTNELTWSDEIYRIFGLEPQQFAATYEAFLQSIHPKDRKRVELAVKRAVDGDSPYTINHLVVRPNGETRLVHEQAKITRDNDGKVLRMLGTVHDITELTHIEEMLHSKNLLIKAIQQLQSRFITNSEPFSMYQGLLDDILGLTESDYGFIAEMNSTPDGETYLKTYALTNLAWDEETRKLYEDAQDKGVEYHDLDNLFGYVITSGKAVISNDPHHSGLPEGHPEISAFLGIPVYFGDQIVGQIGLANRQGGYNQELLDYLNPLIVAYGQIIAARQDQLARNAAEKALSKMAKIDGLLGIPNRRSFDEYIEQQYGLSCRQQTALSLILIDVDHFKLFNDQYGHQTGDACLIEIAAIIQESLQRPSDMVARYGGEEFCCILPGTTTKGAVMLAKRIQKKLADSAIPHITSPVSDAVTVSMGISSREPEDEITLHELIARADQFLYEAKAAGRNGIKTWEMESKTTIIT